MVVSYRQLRHVTDPARNEAIALQPNRVGRATIGPMRSAVALINSKGGVGKTSVALGLASAAWAASDHVLVVDLDPLAAATWSLGIDPDDVARSVADVLRASRSGSIKDAVVGSGWGEAVDVVPGSARLAQRDGVEATIADLERLAISLDGLEELYDAVLIDCGPHLGALAMSALTAADHALIVVEPSEFALRGIGPAVESPVPSRRKPTRRSRSVASSSTSSPPTPSKTSASTARSTTWPVSFPYGSRPYPSASWCRRPPPSGARSTAFGPKATEVTDAFDHLWLRTRRMLLRSGVTRV